MSISFHRNRYTLNINQRKNSNYNREIFFSSHLRHRHKWCSAFNKQHLGPPLVTHPGRAGIDSCHRLLVVSGQRDDISSSLFVGKTQLYKLSLNGILAGEAPTSRHHFAIWTSAHLFYWFKTENAVTEYVIRIGKLIEQLTC